MLTQDFNEFAEVLNAHGVEHLVGRGYAQVAVHGHLRYTGDIDFRRRPDVHSTATALDARQAIGLGSLSLKAEDFGADTVIQLSQPPRRTDLLAGADGFSSTAATRGAGWVSSTVCP